VSHQGSTVSKCHRHGDALEVDGACEGADVLLPAQQTTQSRYSLKACGHHPTLDSSWQFVCAVWVQLHWEGSHCTPCGMHAVTAALMVLPAVLAAGHQAGQPRRRDTHISTSLTAWQCIDCQI